MAFAKFLSAIIGLLFLVSIITFQLTGESRENKTKKRVFCLKSGIFLKLRNIIAELIFLSYFFDTMLLRARRYQLENFAQGLRRRHYENLRCVG